MKSKASRVFKTAMIAVGLATLAWGTQGCNSTGCTDNRSSVPLAGFYSSATLYAISLDSIDVYGVGAPGDSLLLGAGTRASQVYLPLRSDRENVTFQIDYRNEVLDGLSDIIVFTYESFPYFASEECGAMYRYKINDIYFSGTFLDSIAITASDSIITNAEMENIQLFFRTE